MPAEEKLITVAEVLRKCGQEVSTKEAETIIAKQGSKTIDEKCRETRGVSVDLKKLITSVSTMKNSEDASNRIDKIDEAIEVLTRKSKPLEKSMNSELFSTESELLECCISATKETLHNLSGVSSLDPVAAADRFIASIDGIRKSVQHRRPDGFPGATVNSLLVMEPEEQITNSDFFDDSEIEKSNRFASRLGFLDEHYGEVARWCSTNRAQIFGSHPSQNIVLQRLQPALWENCHNIEFMMSLVNVAKVEKEKKTRENTKKEKKEKAELVKLTDKAAATVQDEEVSIMKELHHVRKSLKNVLRARETDSIRYYEFIMDPNDFFKTVENMFYLSYLIRDRAVFLVCEDGVPILKNGGDLSEETKQELESTSTLQGIAQLSKPQWTELKSLYDTACIPPKRI